MCESESRGCDPEEAPSPSDCDSEALICDCGVPSNMSSLLAFELTQAAPQSCCLNDAAFMNMQSILVTLDTSHFEMSALKDRARKNMSDMSSTLDTSHFEMSLSNIVA